MDFDWRAMHAKGYSPHRAVVEAIYEQGGAHTPQTQETSDLTDEAKDTTTEHAHPSQAHP